jgi:oligosaccharide 4-alpha-D-glucosyltransferase
MKKLYTFLLFGLFALLFSITAFSQDSYSSHTSDNNRLTITTGNNNTLEILPYSENIIKVVHLEEGETLPPSISTAVSIDSDISVSITNETDEISISFGEVKAIVNKSNLGIKFSENDEEKIAQLPFNYNDGNLLIDFITTTQEKLYGAGSRAIASDRKGTQLPNYNTQWYGYEYGAQAMNVSIPFILSSEKYGIFFDNHSAGTMDLGESSLSNIQFSATHKPMSYFIIMNDSYEEIVKDFSFLTGKQPLPPRWAMGYIQSKFGYWSQTETQGIVNTMLEENFPIDGIILDLYWQGDIGTMNTMDWEYSRWGSPTFMMANFKALGVETIVITEPYFTLNSGHYNTLDDNEWFTKDNEGNSFLMKDFWAGWAGLMDIFIPEAQDWMWTYYADRKSEGVGGWWCDLGEPENHPQEMIHTTGSVNEVHNAYSQEWAKFLFEKYRENYPEERLFNLIRSGYAGMQRYSTFPWSGDVSLSSEGMQAQVPIMLGMSVCGVPYMSSDLGGFTGSTQNPELYVRWMQMGVFTPIARAHGTGVTEPINQPEEYKDILRTYTHLRHTLMPYNYTLSWENSTTGMPLARPMYFYDETINSYAYTDAQYFWGEDFLISPVYNLDATSQNVYVPEGVWINYWTNETYTGSTVESIETPLSTMPVLIKAGSIIPSVPYFPTIKTYDTDTLEIAHYPDPSVEDNTYRMYNDDGISFHAIDSGNYEYIDFASSLDEGNIKLDVSRSGDYNPQNSRHLKFTFHRISTAPGSVAWNLTNLDSADDLESLNATTNAYFFDEESQLLYVHANWDGNESSLSVNNIRVSNKSVLINYSEPIIAFNKEHEQIYLEFDSRISGFYRVEVFNVLGRKVNTTTSEMQSGTNFNTLDASSLQKGVYIVKIKQNNRVTSKKILIQ